MIFVQFNFLRQVQYFILQTILSNFVDFSLQETEKIYLAQKPYDIKGFNLPIYSTKTKNKRYQLCTNVLKIKYTTIEESFSFQ